MKLIDADALIQKLNDKKILYSADINEAILNTPTVEERKKGRWIYASGVKDEDVYFQFVLANCSCCGAPCVVTYWYNFCPACGADMREVKE